MIPQTARTRIGASVIVGAFVVSCVAACSPMAVPATSTPSATTASDAPIVPGSAAESAEDPTSPTLVCADAYTLDETTTCPWRGLGADNPDEFVRTSVAGGKVTVECDYGEQCGWQLAGFGPGGKLVCESGGVGGNG